jgi:hypothetical protein
MPKMLSPSGRGCFLGLTLTGGYAGKGKYPKDPLRARGHIVPLSPGLRTMSGGQTEPDPHDLSWSEGGAHLPESPFWKDSDLAGPDQAHPIHARVSAVS